MSMNLNPTPGPIGGARKTRPYGRRPPGLLAIVALLAACGSAPATHWHSLLPVEPPAARGPASPAGRPLPIVLAPIGLPAQVDQPQFVLRLPDGSLTSLEQERWASPLRDELRAALLERLANRYDVVSSLGEAAAGEAPLRIAVTLSRFDSVLGREALIEGSWLVSQAGGGTAHWSCRWLVRESAAGGAASLAQAHQKAWARVADALGEGLRAAAPAQPACPRFDSPG